MGLLKRFIEWLIKRADQCPRCGADYMEIVIWSDGELQCRACGYTSFKERR